MNIRSKIRLDTIGVQGSQKSSNNLATGLNQPLGDHASGLVARHFSLGQMLWRNLHARETTILVVSTLHIAQHVHIRGGQFNSQTRRVPENLVAGAVVKFRNPEEACPVCNSVPPGGGRLALAASAASKRPSRRSTRASVAAKRERTDASLEVVSLVSLRN